MMVIGWWLRDVSSQRRKNVQGGVLWVSGCLEHPIVIYTIIEDAKGTKVTWQSNDSILQMPMEQDPTNWWNYH